MAHTETSARDAVLGLVNTTWLGSGVTSPYGILWGNVRVTEEDLAAVRYDAQGNPLPYARATARTLVSGQETLGPPGVAKYQTEGLLVVQIFTPPGDGNELADAIVEVLKRALRGTSIGELWFFDVYPQDGGIDKAWHRTDLRASYRFGEV